MKTILLTVLLSTLFVGCRNDSSVVSQNISEDANNFKVERRTVFYNSMNGEYILTIQGFCSINVDKNDNQLEVTCKVADNKYKKHYLGLSSTVSYFSEQIESTNSTASSYKVTFKPSVILNTVEVR